MALFCWKFPWLFSINVTKFRWYSSQIPASRRRWSWTSNSSILAWSERPIVIAKNGKIHDQEMPNVIINLFLGLYGIWQRLPFISRSCYFGTKKLHYHVAIVDTLAHHCLHFRRRINGGCLQPKIHTKHWHVENEFVFQKITCGLSESERLQVLSINKVTVLKISLPFIFHNPFNEIFLLCALSRLQWVQILCENTLKRFSRNVQLFTTTPK